MKRKQLLVYSLTIFMYLNFTLLNAQVTGVKVGSFDQFSDIGSPKTPGTASYNEKEQTYLLKGSGANIWFGDDSFSFLSKKMNGDFIIQTRILFSGKGHELHRKTGLMIRKSNDSDSPVVACTVHGDGLTSLQYRIAPGDTMKEVKFTISGPDVLQLEKKGNTYIMSVAHFGEVYQVQRVENINLGTDLSAGLFICSHNNDYTEEVEFSNTMIFNTAPDNLVQYQTYLGSMLEVMDVNTGHREVLASDEGSWQAPNWTPDNKTLIYNASGKLYNFDLATRKSTVLNTDFANSNNNDHVLTFDGKQLGISHQPEETNRQSVVYTVPVTGGVPKRITDKSPSYFHGWSPDNQFLLYTGERNGDFDIYKISKDGGTEIRLTTTRGLDDGSEYSSDGKYIYFCSTRTGKMQIWRMDPDGKNQTQLTFDELNNWFPHVSPDNKWLVFISFPKEVPADSHPFYERVYLRMMPAGGGEVKVIAYLYGGQGTINVPSWSPDSKKIAFVSNGTFVQPQAKKTAGSHIKLALNAFSFNDVLLAKETPEKPAFTLFDLLDWCAVQNIEALDVTGYYFPTYPEVPSDEYIYELKRKAFSLGIDISGTGIRNNFASPDPVVRKADVERAKKWIIVAEKLGAPVIRLFAGEIPKGYESKWDEVAGWMIECYKECAAFGAQHGVIIGIQNHGDMLQTADQCIKVVKAVNSSWAGIILDTGNFKVDDPYADIEAVIPYTVNWQVKESVLGNTSEVKTDFIRLMKIIKKSGYRGYVPVETLKLVGKVKPYDPFVLVPQIMKELNAAKDVAFNN